MGATMPRKPGTPKTGGRTAGTPNRRNAALAERIAAAMGEGWCPVVALARIAEDKGTDPQTRVRCLAEVAPYLYPRKKATEHAFGAGFGLEELIAASNARALAQPMAPTPAPAAPPAEPSRIAPAREEPEARPTPAPEPAPLPPPTFRMPLSAVEDSSYADTSVPYNPN